MIPILPSILLFGDGPFIGNLLFGAVPKVIPNTVIRMILNDASLSMFTTRNDLTMQKFDCSFESMWDNGSIEIFHNTGTLVMKATGEF